MKMKDPFEQAVKEHGETVFRVCRAVLGPSPDAEDAWSETFLAALRARTATDLIVDDATARAVLELAEARGQAGGGSR